MNCGISIQGAATQQLRRQMEIFKLAQTYPAVQKHQTREWDSQYHRGLKWLKTSWKQNENVHTKTEYFHTHKLKWKDLEDHKSDWNQVLMSMGKRVLAKSLPCSSHHGLSHNYLLPTPGDSKLLPGGKIWLATCCINNVLLKHCHVHSFTYTL